MRIGFIGGGYMGEALVSSFLKNGPVSEGDVTVSDVSLERREYLESEYGITTTQDNADAVRDADVLVLAVKPQEFENVAAPLKGSVADNATILSIMAGVSVERIAADLGHAAIVRVMPNTAAFVGEAMSVWTASDAVSGDAKQTIAKLLGTLGQELEVDDEALVDLATAVNGSGPGFIFYILEGLIDGAERIGFEREQAEALAAQTLYGAALMARDSGKSATELREMVTSKGGTTAAGLEKLDEAGVRSAIIVAIIAAHERAKEL